MIYLKRKSMKKYVVVYKRKKYIKVATAIGSKFYRILVVICLLFSCITINAKTIRVFTGNIQRVEKTVRIDGNTYFLTLKDGTMYQLENEKQYSIVLESWKYFKFIMIDVKDNGKKEIPLYHTVKADQTIYAISREYNVPVNRLLKLNPTLKNGKVVTGQKIKLKEK